VTSGSANDISGNRIFNNGGLGIDLGFISGVTPNDPGDSDIGENYLQNYPVLTAAASAYGSTEVHGTLNSAASLAFRLEFFASPPWDAAGIGEGQVFLGATTVTTGADGNASFTSTLPTTTPTNFVVTATATDANGNTSEFSAAAPAITGSPGATLMIAPSGNNTTTVTWPSAASLFQLETTGSLSPTSQWHIVTSGIVDLGQLKSLSVTNASVTNQFFRLKKS